MWQAVFSRNSRVLKNAARNLIVVLSASLESYAEAPEMEAASLIPAATAIVGHFPAEKLATSCFSARSLFQAVTVRIFWTYLTRRQKQFAIHSDARLLAITALVWFMISIGWLVPIFLGFVSIYAAIAAWILWPNIVAVWGSDKRRALQAAILRRGDLNGKKKGRQQKNTDRKISSFRALYV